jgi:hypothetical protein
MGFADLARNNPITNDSKMKNYYLQLWPGFQIKWKKGSDKLSAFFHYFYSSFDIYIFIIILGSDCTIQLHHQLILEFIISF